MNEKEYYTMGDITPKLMQKLDINGKFKNSCEASTIYVLLAHIVRERSYPRIPRDTVIRLISSFEIFESDPEDGSSFELWSGRWIG